MEVFTAEEGNVIPDVKIVLIPDINTCHNLGEGLSYKKVARQVLTD